MASIKIVSNPYVQRITYYLQDKQTKEWIEITSDGSDYNKLTSEELTKEFFPFKVKEIVKYICKEYMDGDECVKIYFEGTDDEYREIREICKKNSEFVVLQRGEVCLENARDILPNIRDIFTHLEPLIRASLPDESKVETQLKKYKDASGDVIPVCVVGNYSSGKSSFINALIGSEVLPSGALPVTAKVYSIKPSDRDNYALIRFSFEGYDDKITIYLEDGDYRFSHGIPKRGDLGMLMNEIDRALEKSEKEFLASRVNKVLSIINDYDAEEDEDYIGDLIELEVPFVGGLLGKSKYQFAIFDTPGSNSSSNAKHFKVLKDEMEDLSNGLPIYVSEYNGMDSNDNEALCTLLKGMKELDSRFAMIIVNKADSADIDNREFTPRETKQILKLTLPKNLYSEGIFFVSSIMGLGSKNDGNFVVRHGEEIFVSNRDKFSNPENPYYKQLFLNNIMPEQMKERVVEESTAYSDAIFANSGFFCVEKEIVNFAEKYSSYNKCQQAKTYLAMIIAVTEEEIAKAKADRQRAIEDRNKELERDKAKLIEDLTVKSEELQGTYTTEYNTFMSVVQNSFAYSVTPEDLDRKLEEIFASQGHHMDFEGKKQDVRNAFKSITDHLKGNIKAGAEDFSADAIKRTWTSFLDDVQNTIDSYELQLDTKKAMVQATSRELVDRTRTDFTAKTNDVQQSTDKQSRSYWAAKTELLKQAMIAIVTGAESLSEEKRKELSDIIITYESLVFEDLAERIFVLKDFTWALKFMDTVIIDSDRINVSFLSKRYNEEMQNAIAKTVAEINDKHQKAFLDWAVDLLGIVVENIIDYSPSLQRQTRLIREEEMKIAEIKARQKKIEDYMNEIDKMMEWKSC